jgi:hypothetical protein
MEYELKFLNPTFNKGLNITVRAGIKWSKVKVGDSLILLKTDGEAVLGKVLVIGTLCLPAKFVPEELLVFEHDPNCQNRKGLFEVMGKIYPDFTEDSFIVILMFDYK